MGIDLGLGFRGADREGFEVVLGFCGGGWRWLWWRVVAVGSYGGEWWWWQLW